jgi:hypothetical protein
VARVDEDAEVGGVLVDEQHVDGVDVEFLLRERDDVLQAALGGAGGIGRGGADDLEDLAAELVEQLEVGDALFERLGGLGRTGVWRHAVVTPG